MAKILVFAGSARQEAYSRRFARVAAAAARAAGADVTHLELADFPLPLMDEDLEKASGPPEAARRLKRIFAEHDALLIATPEYNASLPPLLKNALDWVSRPDKTEPISAYKNKVALMLGSSPGAFGGVRALLHLRQVLANLGVLTLADQVVLPAADRAFDADGNLIDPTQQKRLEDAIQKLITITNKLKS